MGAPTVSANGKSVVTTKSKGKAMATIPDVCLLPVPVVGPIPLPLPNIAESKDLTMGSLLTKFDGGNIATMGSYCSQSKGDEVGVQGGIISGCTKGKAFFIGTSPDVKVEMRPVSRKGDMLIMNMINTLGLTGMNQEDVKPAKEEKSFIEIELHDENGDPLPNEDYIIKSADGKEIKGKLDDNGYAKIENVSGQSYKIRYPNLLNFKKDYKKS